MQNLSGSAERGMSDGSGVVFDLPRSPLETEKSSLVFWTVLNPDTEAKFPRCPHPSLHDATLLGVDVCVHGQACDTASTGLLLVLAGA